MPGSFNKYDIDQQFTDKAWEDMRGRLDKALPIKKPFFLNKWLSFAALFCLLSVGGYWFVLQKGNENLSAQKMVVENQESKIKNENTLQNKTTPSPVIQKLAKNTKPLTKEKKHFENHTNLSVNTPKIQNKLVEEVSYKKEKFPTPSIQLDHSIASNLPTNKKHSMSLLKSAQKKQASKNAQFSSTFQSKKQKDAPKNLISSPKQKNTLTKIEHKDSKSNPTPLPSLNLIAHKNLAPINSYLDTTTNAQFLTKNAPSINQSSTGLLKNRKLITQKNEDEWFNPKTIHYGIKQGLSSDLTSESKIFAGALIDFYFNKKWFVELSPAYQFGAINQKNEVQYDVVVLGNDSFDEPNGDPPPEINTPTENPIQVIEPTPTYVHTKDTGFTTIKANSHHVAAEFLLGYRISSRMEALMGISSAKSFNHQSDNDKLSNTLREPETYTNFNPLLYNSWSLAPKIALRFALKPKLSVETFYAHDLIPKVKQEFQIEKAAGNSTNSNRYFSSSYGLGFVYKFN